MTLVAPESSKRGWWAGTTLGCVKMLREIDFCDKTGDGRKQTISPGFLPAFLRKKKLSHSPLSRLDLWTGERFAEGSNLSQTGPEDAPRRSPTRSVLSDYDYFHETDATMSCGVMWGKREAMERGVIPLHVSNQGQHRASVVRLYCVTYDPWQ